MKLCLSCLIIITFAAAHHSLAQKRLGVGAATGIINTGTNFSAGINQFPEYFTGATGGLFFESMSNRYVGLRWEFLFSQKGFGMQDSLYFYHRHIYYLETPMLTHVELGKNNWRVVLQGGPQVATPIYEREKVDTENILAMRRFDTTYTLTQRTNRLEKFQFGLAVGTGFNYKIANMLLQAEVRYYQGLTNVLAPRRFTFFQAQTFGAHLSLQYIIKNKNR